MHVKESVKDFVHDVKRRFSHHKHKRGESSSSTDTFDTSSTAFSQASSASDATVYSTARSHPATPAPSNPATPAGSMRGIHGRSLPSTPEHANQIPFISSQRVRTPSTPSRKHNVLHKLRRPQSGTLRSRTKSLSGLFGSKEDKDHPGLVPSALTLMHGGLAQVGRDHERRADVHDGSQLSDNAHPQIQPSQIIVSDTEPASDTSVAEPILECEVPNDSSHIDDQVSSTQSDHETRSADPNKDVNENVSEEPTVATEEHGDVVYPHAEADMVSTASTVGGGDSVDNVSNLIDDQASSTQGDREGDSADANKDANEVVNGEFTLAKEEHGDISYPHSKADMAFAESTAGEGDSVDNADQVSGDWAQVDASEETSADVNGEAVVIFEEKRGGIYPHSEVDTACAEPTVVRDMRDDDSHPSHPEVDSPPTQVESLQDTSPQLADSDRDSQAEETLSQSHSEVSETLVSTATDVDDKDSHSALNSDSDDQSNSVHVPLDSPAASDQTSGVHLSDTTPVPTPSAVTVDPMSNIQDSSAPTDLVEQIPGRDPFLDDSEDHESGSGESQQEEIALPSPGPSSVPLNMSKPISPSPSLPQVPSRTVSSPPRPVPTSPVPAPSSPTPAYIPRLTAPSMFLPVPNTDPLSALLTKHVPPERRPRRDVVGEWTGRDMHEMVMSNSWRALAKMAHDRIVKSDPEDLARILDLWSLRLSSLARLRLTNQASAECTNLFAVLNAVPPQHPPSTAATTRGPSDPSAPPLLSPGTNLKGLPLSPGAPPSALPVPTPAQKPLPPLAPASVPSATGTNTALVHPFELAVFHARVHYWTGDTLGYVDALSGILGTCKERARVEGWRFAGIRREMEVRRQERLGVGRQGEHESDDDDDENEEGEGEDGQGDNDDDGEAKILAIAEANLSMWLERTARVCLILASQLVEMKDYQAAITLLTPLCTRRDPSTKRPIPSPAVYSAVGRIYLIAGNVPKAVNCFEIAASCYAPHKKDQNSSSEGERPQKDVDIGGSTEFATASETVAMNDALLSAALGNWDKAEEALRGLLESEPENFTAMNNLAVALFGQGRITEGIELLEAALRISPSTVVVAEPFLFNLSTLYELRSATAIDKKRELLIEVAKWSGDGLKTTCLKMPSN